MSEETSWAVTWIDADQFDHLLATIEEPDSAPRLAELARARRCFRRLGDDEAAKPWLRRRRELLGWGPMGTADECSTTTGGSDA